MTKKKSVVLQNNCEKEEPEKSVAQNDATDSEELQVLPIEETSESEIKDEEVAQVDDVSNSVDAPLIEEVENAVDESLANGATDENVAEEDNSDKALDETASEDAPVGKKKRKKKKISDITFENDIRYRGPMSYRWLRIFAWVSIVCAQAAIILTLGMKVDAKLAKNYAGFTAFLSIMGTLSVPLFLMANFAVIINAKNGYKRLLVSYAFMVLVIFSLFMLIYQRYLLGIMNLIVDKENGQTPQDLFNDIFKAFSTSGFLAFNIFVDLFLCTLFTFFVNYTPQKVFVGKKLIIFRLFAILPVLYEIASLTLKVLCVMHDGFTLPLYVSPFLTTKPPLTFLVFVVLAFFIKNRERVFIKRGKTQEEYGEFLKTNTNSLHFSIATSVCMIVAAILDLVLFFVAGTALSVFGEDGEILVSGATLAQQIGFGKSVPLLLVIPFIMLFSYTRTHKPSAIDVIIPNIGMVAFVICYVEGLYQFILRLPEIIGKMFN